MFYKETKILAAHYILRTLYKHKSVLTRNGIKEMHRPFYGFFSLKEIKKENRLFSLEILRDAALLLTENNEIELLENQNHIYEIKIKIIDPKGTLSAKEWTYFKIFIKSARVITTFIGAIGASLLWLKSCLQPH